MLTYHADRFHVSDDEQMGVSGVDHEIAYIPGPRKHPR